MNMRASEDYMTRIAITMHIIQGDEDTEGFKNAIEKCVDDLSFRWNIYHEMVDITSKAIIIPPVSYTHLTLPTT